MITWKATGKQVKAKMSHNFESMIFALNRFNPKTGQLEFIDKHGFKYYTYSKNVEFLDMPDEKVNRISELMDYEDFDIYY